MRSFFWDDENGSELMGWCGAGLGYTKNGEGSPSSGSAGKCAAGQVRPAKFPHGGGRALAPAVVP